MVSCVAQAFSMNFLKIALARCEIQTDADSWKQFEACFSVGLDGRSSVKGAQAGTL
jgi:hypothetical protein